MSKFLKEHEQAMINVLIYIQKNFGEKIKIDTLCKVAGLSAFHFHRLFKIYTGESVGNYLRKIRLEKAIRKIYLGDQLTKIAFDVGYSSQSSFSNAFLKNLNLGPKQAQKKLKRSTHPVDLFAKNKILTPEFITLDKDIDIGLISAYGNYFESIPLARNTLREILYKNDPQYKNRRYFLLSRDNPHSSKKKESEFKVDICFSFQGELCEKLSNQVKVQTLKQGRYARFMHQGAEVMLGKSFHYIFSIWHGRTQKIDFSKDFFVEFLDETLIVGQFVHPKNRRCFIYIPIVS